jgi:tripartite motif-containing protein 71
VVDQGNKRIQKFTSAGAFVTQWGSEGENPGEFERPYGIAIDGDDFVYVADGDHDLNRIQKFTSAGDLITQWSTNNDGKDNFDEAFGVAVDANSRVYVTDLEGHTVRVFSSTGALLAEFGSN